MQTPTVFTVILDPVQLLVLLFFTIVVVAVQCCSCCLVVVVLVLFVVFEVFCYRFSTFYDSSIAVSI